MKKEIITIAGKPGSGKSTTANAVARLLDYERYSSGDFMREVGTRRGLTVAEVNEVAETDHSLDREVDAALEQIGKTHTKLVIDSRLAFHWIPESFKVYLELDLAVAAGRIFKEDSESRRASGETASTQEEMYESIARRFESEQKRYYDLYKIDPHNTTHFDLVVDTTHEGIDKIAEHIVEEYRKWLQE